METLEHQLRELPILLSLYRYWDGKRAGRPMPAWPDLDLLEMRAWLGNVNLVDVQDGGRTFRYRVFGTNVAQATGHDMTGRYVHELPAEVAEEVGRTYSEVYSTGKPLFVSHRQDSGVGLFRHYRLVLPLGPGDGEVSNILVGAWPVNEARRPIRSAPLGR
ncbi:MAG: PAS domain-containing protein [Alphaproteobacteria bacterium]|nr:PAS domain-containing protein [Alphaproteobacteria bacterium]